MDDHYPPPTPQGRTSGKRAEFTHRMEGVYDHLATDRVVHRALLEQRRQDLEKLRNEVDEAAEEKAEWNRRRDDACDYFDNVNASEQLATEIATDDLEQFVDEMEQRLIAGEEKNRRLEREVAELTAERDRLRNSRNKYRAFFQSVLVEEGSLIDDVETNFQSLREKFGAGLIATPTDLDTVDEIRPPNLDNSESASVVARVSQLSDRLESGRERLRTKTQDLSDAGRKLEVTTKKLNLLGTAAVNEGMIPLDTIDYDHLVSFYHLPDTPTVGRTEFDDAKELPRIPHTGFNFDAMRALVESDKLALTTLEKKESSLEKKLGLLSGFVASQLLVPTAQAEFPMPKMAKTADLDEVHDDLPSLSDDRVIATESLVKSLGVQFEAQSGQITSLGAEQEATRRLLGSITFGDLLQSFDLSQFSAMFAGNTVDCEFHDEGLVEVADASLSSHSEELFNAARGAMDVIAEKQSEVDGASLESLGWKKKCELAVGALSETYFAVTGMADNSLNNCLDECRMLSARLPQISFENSNAIDAISLPTLLPMRLLPDAIAQCVSGWSKVEVLRQNQADLLSHVCLPTVDTTQLSTMAGLLQESMGEQQALCENVEPPDTEGFTDCLDEALSGAEQETAQKIGLTSAAFLEASQLAQFQSDSIAPIAMQSDVEHWETEDFEPSATPNFAVFLESAVSGSSREAEANRNQIKTTKDQAQARLTLAEASCGKAEAKLGWVSEGFVEANTLPTLDITSLTITPAQPASEPSLSKTTELDAADPVGFGSILEQAVVGSNKSSRDAILKSKLLQNALPEYSMEATMSLDSTNTFSLQTPADDLSVSDAVDIELAHGHGFGPALTQAVSSLQKTSEQAEKKVGFLKALVDSNVAIPTIDSQGIQSAGDQAASITSQNALRGAQDVVSLDDDYDVTGFESTLSPTLASCKQAEASREKLENSLVEANAKLQLLTQLAQENTAEAPKLAAEDVVPRPKATKTTVEDEMTSFEYVATSMTSQMESAASALVCRGKERDLLRRLCEDMGLGLIETQQTTAYNQAVQRLQVRPDTVGNDVVELDPVDDGPAAFKWTHEQILLLQRYLTVVTKLLQEMGGRYERELQDQEQNLREQQAARGQAQLLQGDEPRLLEPADERYERELQDQEQNLRDQQAAPDQAQ